jgi:hypothetical protein
MGEVRTSVRVASLPCSKLFSAVAVAVAVAVAIPVSIPVARAVAFAIAVATELAADLDSIVRLVFSFFDADAILGGFDVVMGG